MLSKCQLLLLLLSCNNQLYHFLQEVFPGFFVLPLCFLDFSIVTLFILYLITGLCSLLTCKDWVFFVSVFPECPGVGAQRCMFSQTEFHFRLMLVRVLPRKLFAIYCLHMEICLLRNGI